MAQDLRYAWRLIRKSPGFAAVVGLTLAFGIGANTAVFSVVNGVILHPLPYKDPARLVDVLDASVKDPNLSKTFSTYSDFEEYARQAHSFEKIAFATWAGAGATLTGYGAARNVLAIPVSEDFFSTLGVPAVRGRTFEHADLSRGCSVVLSDRFFSSTLAGDAGIVGRSLNLGHRACTVLGVMPARFEFYPRQTQLWMLFTADDPRPRDRFLVIPFARLKPGVTAAQAQAELAALHKQIPQADWHRDFTPVVDRLQDEFSFLAGRNLRATLGLLVAAVALVLLIACLNVAHLLLARASARRRELAVRAALGSGRARLIRQLLVEGLLLAGIGGGVGVVVALAAVKYFLHANFIELPVGTDITISVPVLLFTALVTVATALVFGIAPAWSGSRASVDGGLRAAGRGSITGANRRLASVLIAAEISLSLMLLTGAGLLMRSVLKMSAAPLGFDPDHLMVMSTGLPAERYAGAPEKLQFYEALRSRLNAIPGAEGSAIATVMPPYGSGSDEVQVEGKARGGVQDVGQNMVSADYFHVLRIALLRGRLFDSGDGPGSAPVAVVNQKFASEYFPGADPVGQRVRAFGFKDGPWLTVVGVVATEKRPELMHEMSWHESAALYRPIAQEPSGKVEIALRTQGDQIAAGHAMERVLAEIDKQVPLGEVSTMRDLLGSFLKYPRFRAMVIGLFAGLALLLAALGLHGLLLQYVSQRTRELGLRMAVGARPADIVRMVAVHAGIPVLAGLSAGMVLTGLLTRYLSSLLFEVTPGDAWTMIAAPAVLLASALAAILKPAWDAAAVDPAVALRDE
jgi:predicted permease